MSTVSTTTTSTVSAATVTRTGSHPIYDDPWGATFFHPMYLEHHQKVRESMVNALTPLNVALFVALLTLVYYRIFKPYNSSAATLSSGASAPGSNAVVFQTFTPRTLLRFNGVKSEPLNPEGKVYIAVKGKVHDVTAGRNFYGPGGPYENFAGRDATRGLACQSFDEDMLTKDLDGPLDDCADLGPDQLENLQGWVERFDEKYLVVGKLTAFDSRRSWGS